MNCNGCACPITDGLIKDWLGNYCSEPCQAIYHKRRKLKEPKQKTCDHCGKGFQSARGPQRFCSYECRARQSSIDGNNRFKEKMKLVYPDGIKRKPCEWCDEVLEVPVQKSLTQRRYHEACSLEAQRARYRIKTTKRRTLQKPNRISADQVVREYGDDCHICTQKIDLSLPRTSKQGLTIDHVIPLSKGGSDEMENLRPAHWICNNRKSDKLDA